MLRDNLVHWRYYGSSLPPELWYLIDSLDEMARRWLGSATHGRCLASTYADRLRDLHRHCLSAPNFSVDVLGYSTIVSNHTPSIASTTSAQSPSNNRRQYNQETHRSIATHPTSSANLGPSHPLPPWNIHDEIISPHNANSQLSEPVAPVPMGYPNDPPPADELSTISYLLLDQRFMDMDRVISLDDMMFSTNMVETNQ